MSKSEWGNIEGSLFLRALSENIIEADNQEYLEERKKDGVDVKAIAKRTRESLLSGVRQFFLEQLTQLEEATSEAPKSERSGSYASLPLEALKRILAEAKAKLSPQQELTLCFREREEGDLSRDEIESQLEKLIEYDQKRIKKES